MQLNKLERSQVSRNSEYNKKVKEKEKFGKELNSTNVLILSSIVTVTSKMPFKHVLKRKWMSSMSTSTEFLIALETYSLYMIRNRIRRNKSRTSFLKCKV